MARATTIDAILAEAEVKAIVVPLHPALTGECGSELARRAGSEKRDVRQVNVVRDGASWRVVVAGLAQGALGKWSRDAFGRLEFGTVGRTRSDTRLRIGVVGSERDHRCAYPAGIAALGDAADHLGRSVDITFIDPPSLRPIDVPEILDGIDGVVLPGGADMINVPGQIMMARGTLEARKPTLGLCLGMQTMTTAALQRALNTKEINLAEADPSAPIKSFIAMGDTPGLDEHRLGDRTIRTEPDSALERGSAMHRPSATTIAFASTPPCILTCCARGCGRAPGTRRVRSSTASNASAIRSTWVCRAIPSFCPALKCLIRL